MATSYTSLDGRITSQNDGTNHMYFRYDKNNSLTGFDLNGTEYLYVKMHREILQKFLTKMESKSYPIPMIHGEKS